MEPSAAAELIDYLKRQRERTGADLPHRHHLLVEHAGGGQDGSQDGGRRVILHTLWGGMVNGPLSLLLSAAWEEKYRPEVKKVSRSPSRPGTGPLRWA